MTEPDIFELLGLKRTATPESVKQRYREASRSGPYRHEDAGGTREAFEELQGAFEAYQATPYLSITSISWNIKNGGRALPVEVVLRVHTGSATIKSAGVKRDEGLFWWIEREAYPQNGEDIMIVVISPLDVERLTGRHEDTLEFHVDDRTVSLPILLVGPEEAARKSPATDPIDSVPRAEPSGDGDARPPPGSAGRGRTTTSGGWTPPTTAPGTTRSGARPPVSPPHGAPGWGSGPPSTPPSDWRVWLPNTKTVVIIGGILLFVIIALATSRGSKSPPTVAATSPPASTQTGPSAAEVQAKEAEATAANAETRIKSLSFKCLLKYVCHKAPEGHRLPIFIDGMDENLRTYLEKRGYRDRWSDNVGAIDGQTIGPHASTHQGVYAYEYVAHVEQPGSGNAGTTASGTGLMFNEIREGTHLIAFEGGTEPREVSGHSRWTLTWTLFDPHGHVAKRLRYSVGIVSCEADASYCELVKNYKSRLEEEHSSLAPQENYSYSSDIYTPPPAFKVAGPIAAASPTQEMNLGEITNVRTTQLSPTKVRVSWDNPHDPSVVGFLIDVVGPNEIRFAEEAGAHDTSQVENTLGWKQSWRPRKEQLWQFCVAPLVETNGQRDEVGERQGCAASFRWH